jgi:4-amino-4-deoxy-L-arabinose transferase-like glycosyltransferase
MVRTGNYWAPTWPDGTYRFNKPILTYWVLYFSYRMFGIGNASSQIPFLLIGCGTLALVYKLAKRLYDSRFTGLLALCILLGNFEFNRIFPCSITDGLLSFAALVSHFGFMQILLRDRRNLQTLACAWLGLGLGVTTKGWVGGIPFMFVVLYGVVHLRPIETLRKVAHIPLMLAGAALGTAWMAVMLYMYGDAFTNTIYHDQVGRRLVNVTFLTNLYYYPLILLFEFAPWLIPLAFAAWLKRAMFVRAFRERRAELVYAGLTLGLLLFLFMPGNQARARYMLPAFPIVAVGLAGWLSALDPAYLLTAVRNTTRFIGIVFLAVALLAAVAGNAIDPRIVIGAGAMGALCVLFMVLVGQSRLAIPSLALLTLGAIAINDGLLEGTLHATPAPLLARALNEHVPQPDRVVVATGKTASQAMIELGSQLNVETHGRSHVLYNVRDENAPLGDAIVFTELEKPRLNLADFDVQEIATNYAQFDPFYALREWWKGKASEFYAQSRRTWFLAIRKNLPSKG